MQHPDEGTIHAWLDGALSDDEARAVEEHVSACTECAARAAEARGLVAGASRILGALDGVPAGVVPGTGRRTRSASRTAWWRRPAVGMAAAMTIVAAGTTMVVTRDWQQAPPSVLESADPIGSATDQIARVDTPAPASTVRPAESRPSVEKLEAEPALPPRPTAAAPPRAAGSAATRQAQEPPVAATDERAATRMLVATAQRAPEVDSGQARGAAYAGKVAARTAAEGAPPAAPTPDSVARVEMPRLADVAAPGRSEARARESTPSIAGGYSLMTTAAQLAGCYALELRPSPDRVGLTLPSVVQLATSARDAADAVAAPSVQGFNRSLQPLLVPPAMDSAQLGWRLAADDSVAVRLAANGRAVLVTFPSVFLEPGMGLATAAELPGVPSWTAPVLVQRVPCP
jgi:hypothetical protein